MENQTIQPAVPAQQERRAPATQSPTAITFASYDPERDLFQVDAEVMGEVHRIPISSQGLLNVHLLFPGTVFSMAMDHVLDHPTQHHPRCLVGMTFTDRRQKH